MNGVNEEEAYLDDKVGMVLWPFVVLSIVYDATRGRKNITVI